MKYRRAYHTLTVLPDGKVLASGGQNGTDGVDQTTGILATEIWDPDTNTWTTGASTPPPAPVPLVGAAAARRPRAAGRRRRLRQRQEREERRDLLAALPVQGPAPAGHGRAGPRATTTPAFTVDTPGRVADREGQPRPHGLGDAQRRHGPAARPAELHQDRATASRSPGRANANVAPPGLVHGVPGRRQRRAVPRPDRPRRRGRRHDGADRSGHADRDGPPGRRQPRLDGVDRQRRRHRVPRVPLDDVGLHAVVGEPDRPRQERHDLHRTRGVAGRDVLLQVQAVDAAGNQQPVLAAGARSVVAGDTTAPTVVGDRSGQRREPHRHRRRSRRRRPTPSASQSVQFKLDGADLGAADTTRARTR